MHKCTYSYNVQTRSKYCTNAQHLRNIFSLRTFFLYQKLISVWDSVFSMTVPSTFTISGLKSNKKKSTVNLAVLWQTQLETISLRHHRSVSSSASWKVISCLQVYCCSNFSIPEERASNKREILGSHQHHLRKQGTYPVWKRFERTNDWKSWILLRLICNK